MKVYVVCEYPHGVEDEIHSIVLVTAKKHEARDKEAMNPLGLFVEEFEVKYAAGSDGP